MVARPFATASSGFKSRHSSNKIINGRQEVGFNEVKTFLDGKFTGSIFCYISIEM